MIPHLSAFLNVFCASLWNIPVFDRQQLTGSVSEAIVTPVCFCKEARAVNVAFSNRAKYNKMQLQVYEGMGTYDRRAG